MPVGGHAVILYREWTHQPWGLRVVGGCDLNKPFNIIRVATNSPAEKSNIKAGDMILQIEDYDGRDLRHQDALMLFQNAGHQIKLVIERDCGPGPAPPKEWFKEPAPLPCHADRDINAPTQLNSALEENTSTSEFLDIANQPYRTTPLVLPGAKAKREFHPNESYLRHHPNPMFRQAPSNPLNRELSMKQKVADTVFQKVEQETGGKQISHKQFNSPMGLYSDQNIADTIVRQAGSSMPPRKTVQYDPVKSETYKALQDEEIGPNVHEVTVPIETKLFSPTKTAPPVAKIAQPHPVPGPHVRNIELFRDIKKLLHKHYDAVHRRL